MPATLESFSTLVRSALSAVCLVAIVQGTARAVIIDDYSVGSITLTKAGATAATAQQSGLDPAHVLAGERNLIVGEFGAAGQSLTIDAPASELRFTTSANNNGYLEMQYGSQSQPLDADLTAGGSDAFLIELAYSIPSFPDRIPPSRISIFTMTASYQTSLNANQSTTTVLPDGSRRVRIPFSVLGSQADLTQVSRIEFELFRLSGGSTFVLRDFRTVPEPATWTLLTSAGVIICRRSGGSRIAL